MKSRKIHLQACIACAYSKNNVAAVGRACMMIKGQSKPLFFFVFDENSKAITLLVHY